MRSTESITKERKTHGEGEVRPAGLGVSRLVDGLGGSVRDIVHFSDESTTSGVLELYSLGSSLSRVVLGSSLEMLEITGLDLSPVLGGGDVLSSCTRHQNRFSRYHRL
jgi:hypothetical protein